MVRSMLEPALALLLARVCSSSSPTSAGLLERRLRSRAALGPTRRAPAPLP